MFPLRQTAVIAVSPWREPLPQDVPPMRAPAKPVLPPCRRAPRWAGYAGRAWAAIVGTKLAPA